MKIEVKTAIMRKVWNTPKTYTAHRIGTFTRVYDIHFDDENEIITINGIKNPIIHNIEYVIKFCHKEVMGDYRALKRMILDYASGDDFEGCWVEPILEKLAKNTVAKVKFYKEFIVF